jgi:hypothetical protein
MASTHSRPDIGNKPTHPPHFTRWLASARKSPDKLAALSHYMERSKRNGDRTFDRRASTATRTRVVTDLVSSQSRGTRRVDTSATIDHLNCWPAWVIAVY